jgi:hypothetical protein
MFIIVEIHFLAEKINKYIFSYHGVTAEILQKIDRTGEEKG